MTTTQASVRTETYYLNNRGSRWVNLTNGQRDKITLQTTSGQSVTRTVAFWESFGNNALAHISYKGHKIRVFADTVLDD